VTEALALAAASALWAGVLTAVSPCPLATNIAAVAYVTRHAGSRRASILSGVLYAIGRSAAYVTLAALLVTSVLSSVAASAALQRHADILMGPLLVLVGMVLLGLLRFPSFGGDLVSRAGERVRDAGAWGGLALGALFALSFCPVSAALYFGTLIPLAASAESPLLLPLLFGLGTAAPVLVYALVLALGSGRVGASVARLQRVEAVLRPATGAVFVLLGVVLSITRIFLRG
jgi:cytochrome c biogenesis protein CcdA